MKLRNKQKFIRVTEEGKPPKSLAKKLNLTRYLYFLFLVFILCFSALYLFDRFYYIEGVGLITFNPMVVRAEDDIKVLNLRIEEGGYVKKHDILFTAMTLENKKKIQKGRPDGDELALRRKIAGVENEIAMKRIKRKYMSERLKQHENELARLERLIKLELVVRDEIGKSRRLIDETKMEILSLKNEIRLLGRYKAQLSGELERYTAVAVVPLPEPPPITNIYSPIDGQVVNVLVHENEMALKGEPVIKLSSLDNMVIRGYFNQKTLKYLGEGVLVNITFPDGTDSRGSIARFYYSTMPLPAEFQKKYEPVRRDVIADILPLAGEEKKWVKYHKLSVKITIERYGVFGKLIRVINHLAG